MSTVTHPNRLFLPIALGVITGTSGAYANWTSGDEVPRTTVSFSSDALTTEAPQVSTVVRSSSFLSLLVAPALWLEDAFGKVDAYSKVMDGWKGPYSVAPSQVTLSEAKELLEQFAVEMPSLPTPLISCDEDGSICLHWRSRPMMATVTAHGDGTYSYYAEGFAPAARSDAEEIGMPLPRGIVLAMVEGPMAVNGIE